MPTYDPWSLDTGGFEQDYDATIASITFAPGNYNFQATVVNRYDEPVVGNDGVLRTERSEFITVGGLDQWVATDGGAAFKHVEKDEPKIRANSGWGEFITRMAELVGGPELSRRGTPFEAKTFEGYHLHWGTEGAGVPYSFTDKVTGEQKSGFSKGKQLPDKLLDGAPESVFKMESLALAPDQEAALVGFANEAGSLSEFQAAVMPWMHNAATGLSETQKAVLTSTVATTDGWFAIRTLI